MAYNDRIGELARVTIAATYPNNQVEETNIVMTPSVAGGGDSRLALATAFNAHFAFGWPAVMAPSAAIYGAKVSVLGVFPPPLSVSVVGPTPGVDGTAPTLGTQSRPLVRWLTANGGRQGRGRQYLFTPTATNITASGFVGTALVSLMQAYINFVAAGITTGGTTWVGALSHYVPGTHNPRQYTAILLTGGRTTDLYATQRRSGDTGRINANPW